MLTVTFVELYVNVAFIRCLNGTVSLTRVRE